MNPRISRLLFSCAVLGWSGVLLYFYGSGRIEHYLAPDFRIFTLVGGLGLALLGGFNLLTAGQLSACGHSHDGDGYSPHETTEDMHPITVVLMMLIPVGVAVAWTKDEYSSAALARKGLYDAPSGLNASFLGANLTTLTRGEIEATHPKTPDGFLEFGLMELFLSSRDPEIKNLLDGLKVETVGRWAEEKVYNPKGSRKRLYRMFINCCAADSKAIPIVVEFGKAPPELPENCWVKVAGTIRFLLEDGAMQPVLVAERAAATDSPDEEDLMRNP